MSAATPLHRREARLGLALVASLTLVLGLGAGAVGAQTPPADDPPPPADDPLSELKEAAADLTARAQSDFEAQVESEVGKLLQGAAELKAGAEAALRTELEAAIEGLPPELKMLTVSALTEGCEAHEVESGIHRGMLQIGDTTASVTVILDTRLCAPLTLTLAIFTMDSGGPHPIGNQTLFASDTIIIEAAGTYTWSVPLATTDDGAVCSQQVDFYRGENPPEHLEYLDLMALIDPGGEVLDIPGLPAIGIDIGGAIGQVANAVLFNNGVNIVNLVDGTVLGQADYPLCGVAVLPEGQDVSIEPTSAIKVAGETIPRTGAETPGVVTTGLAVIVAGWLALAINAVLRARDQLTQQSQTS